VNVRDVVTANILAAQSTLSWGAFNIATGKSTTVNDLAHHTLKISRCNIKPTYSPFRKGEVLHSLANIALAKEKLGYEPAVNIEQGLTNYYNFLISKVKKE